MKFQLRSSLSLLFSAVAILHVGAARSLLERGEATRSRLLKRARLLLENPDGAKSGRSNSNSMMLLAASLAAETAASYLSDALSDIADGGGGASGRRLAPCEGVQQGGQGSQDCTVTDLCSAFQSAAPTAEITCEGDEIAEDWTMRVSTETCLYFSQGDEEEAVPFEAAPYDASKFDPDVDSCVIYDIVIGWKNGIPATKEETYAITRSAKDGSFTTSSDFEPTCEKAATNPLANDCATCTGAAMGGTQCNSCSSCPVGSTGSQKLDCSNVQSDFVTDCDTSDVDVFRKMSESSGAICTPEALMAGSCSLDRFCSLFEAGHEENSCSFTGSFTSGEFSLSLAFPEDCEYKATGLDGPYDADLFDPSQDLCVIISANFEGKDGEFTGQGFTEFYTRPNKGRVNIVYPLRTCLPGELDEGFLFVCPDIAACPTVSVNGKPCTSSCITCQPGSDEELAYTCTNVDSRLVGECNEDESVDPLVGYFAENPMEEENETTSAGESTTKRGFRGVIVAIVVILIALAVAIVIKRKRNRDDPEFAAPQSQQID